MCYLGPLLHIWGKAGALPNSLSFCVYESDPSEKLSLTVWFASYGSDPSTAGGAEDGKINVEAVVKMYAQVVIPLTKVVEVEYLMQRLQGTEWE
jgi:hypothetical protein